MIRKVSTIIGLGLIATAALYAQTKVANGAADLAGKIIMVADSTTARTVTNLFTFDRGAAVPFAIGSSSLAVPNLFNYDSLVSSTATGTQNNWAPGIKGNTTIMWSGASAMTLTGMAGGVEGQLVSIYNAGGQVMTVSQLSGSSSAGNKITNIAISAGTPIAARGFAVYQYWTAADSGNGAWVLVQHDQGSWITPTFSAGDFTALTAGTWTVASGDVSVMRYRLSGKSIIVAAVLVTTTVAQSGGNPTVLQIGNGQWGGFASTSAAQQTITTIDNGSWGNGYSELNAAGSVIKIIKNTQSQWANSTDMTYVFGLNFTFEVN